MLLSGGGAVVGEAPARLPPRSGSAPGILYVCPGKSGYVPAPLPLPLESWRVDPLPRALNPSSVEKDERASRSEEMYLSSP